MSFLEKYAAGSSRQNILIILYFMKILLTNFMKILLLNFVSYWLDNAALYFRLSVWQGVFIWKLCLILTYSNIHNFYLSLILTRNPK